MNITESEIDKLAKLARLHFEPEEKQKFQKELSQILGYVDQLKEVAGNAEELEFIDPEALNLMRDDVAEPKPDPEEFLSQAPGREGKFIKVKSILE